LFIIKAEKISRPLYKIPIATLLLFCDRLEKILTSRIPPDIRANGSESAQTMPFHQRVFHNRTFALQG
jgi:hypothetical protein